jgi:hypothetical protein
MKELQEDIDANRELEISGSSCKIIIPLTKARNTPIGIVVRSASRYTKEKIRETGFWYNTKSNKVVSPVFSGKSCEIDVRPMSIGHAGKDEQDGLGDFHVHPSHGKCRFSPQDLLVANAFGFREISLSCPETDVMLFAKSPSSLSDAKRKEVVDKIHKMIDRLEQRDSLIEKIGDGSEKDDNKIWNKYYEIDKEIDGDIHEIMTKQLDQKRTTLKNFARRGRTHVQKSRKR